MKFSCEKALLQGAVNVTGRAVSPKSSIPALEGILMEASGDSLRLTGYNLETGITTTVESQIEQEGSVVLSARLLGDIVRSLSDDMVTISVNGNTVNILCGPTDLNILGIDPSEFPELPQVENGNGLTVSQEHLRKMISQVIFSVSDGEGRPVHTGILFEVEGDTLTLVAVDGHRLALRRGGILGKSGAAGFSFVAPGAAMKELERICTDSGQPVSITEGDRHLTFQIGDTTLVSRRLEGEFIDYRRAVPTNQTISVVGDTADLLASIGRASLIINEKLKSPLRCKFEDGSLSILSKTALGSAFDSCPIQGDGGGLEIGFNNRYLMEAIKAAPADTVKLKLSTPTSPCLILPVEGEENFLYMILPVRLKVRD